MATNPAGRATVKAVNSGDTVVLMGAAQPNAPPPELMVTLAALEAPRMARGADKPDEPHAFASREFLRELCIGKQVQFKVEYKTVGAQPRMMGSLSLVGPDGAVDATSVSKRVVGAGWARVKRGAPGGAAEPSELEELARLEADAVAQRLGVHAPAADDSVRKLNWSVSADDAAALVAKHNAEGGTPTRVLIEYVRDGSAVRAYHLESQSLFSLGLAGIACPRVNPGGPPPPPPAAGADGAAPPPPPAAQPEPFAREARHFVEVRLLHRVVDVALDGVDRHGNLFGTIKHRAGDIAMELLKCGLAKLHEFSLAYVPRPRAAQCRTCERAAKEAKARIWHAWAPPKVDGAREFAALVVEVLSADTLLVLPVADKAGGGDDDAAAATDALMGGTEKRVTLSSIRAPRLGNARRGAPDEPCAAEGKEALRARVIGRTVRVAVEYMRDVPVGGPAAAASGGEPETVKRSFATVTVGKGAKARNVAEELLALGYVTAVRHRNDEERSQAYDLLLAAEAAAKKAGKGVHAEGAGAGARGGADAGRPLNDVTGDPKKAKAVLPYLQRQKSLKGVVDFVFAGNRFKLVIPSENVVVMFALASARAPSTAGPTRRAEPGGEEAKRFARIKLMQRTVEVKIDDSTSSGVALGTLFVGEGGQRRDFGHELVAAGWGKVDAIAAERRGAALAPVKAAQDAARAAKLGGWGLGDAGAPFFADPPAGGEAAAEGGAGGGGPVAQRAVERVPVSVCDVTNGSSFYVHALSDREKLASLEERMRAWAAKVGVKAGAPVDVKRGPLLAALFDDGSGLTWFRARVLEYSADKTSIKVVYVDYGNTATLSKAQLRPLDAALTATPPLARPCELAFAQAPGLDADWGVEAAEHFHGLAWGRTLAMSVYAKGDSQQVVLEYEQAGVAGDEKSGEPAEEPPPATSINEAMVAAGLARVPRGAPATARGVAGAAELLARVEAAKTTAKQGRLGMWRYGDIGDEDDF